MAVMFKCKMCGGDLLLTEGSTIATCEYCGTQQTVPTVDNEKKLSLFTRANRLRAACDFDKAAGIYESIVTEFPEEAEAYWGLILCKYGIEYVDDPTTGKKIPTCHRSSFESVLEDANFELTMENADAVSLKIYRKEAKVIEEIRKGIIEVSSKEDPYDVFICYKETDANGERTVDSLIAQDIYDALKEKGYRVFFSRITLEDKLGVAYEPYIFAALNTAKIMLVVGTAYEHYNAVWVKNEWSRFLKLMEADKSKHLIPCFKDIDAYDIPKEFKHLQAQDMGKVGARADLLRGIDKLVTAKSAAIPAAGVQTEDVNRLYIYNSALEDIKKNTPSSLRNAIQKLRSLGEWENVAARIAEAEKKMKVATRKRIGMVVCSVFVLILAVSMAVFGRRQHIKMGYYEAAQKYESIYAYWSAWEIYNQLGNFKDADKRATVMNQKNQETDNAMAEHFPSGRASYANARSLSEADLVLAFSDTLKDNPATDLRYQGWLARYAETGTQQDPIEQQGFWMKYDVAAEEFLLVDIDTKYLDDLTAEQVVHMRVADDTVTLEFASGEIHTLFQNDNIF